MAAIQHAPAEELTQPQRCLDPAEFDPFSNAKPCSPFYIYNHDSPRPSTDSKPKPAINISINDVESATEQLSPSVSLEKLENGRKPTSKLGVLRGRLLARRQQCLTKPKQKTWLKSLPKRQRIIVKILIAFVIIGCMVGIAVGIAVGLHSSVWKSSNQTSS